MISLLVDTCAAIWIVADAPLRSGAEADINSVVSGGGTLFISPMSGWEVGLLVARGRITLPFSPAIWYDRLAAIPNFAETPVTKDVLIDSHFLPGDPPNDPMDRIMISTARNRGLRILTRDAKILEYADKGHVLAMAC